MFMYPILWTLTGGLTEETFSNIPMDTVLIREGYDDSNDRDQIVTLGFTENPYTMGSHRFYFKQKKDPMYYVVDTESALPLQQISDYGGKQSGYLAEVTLDDENQFLAFNKALYDFKNSSDTKAAYISELEKLLPHEVELRFKGMKAADAAWNLYLFEPESSALNVGVEWELVDNVSQLLGQHSYEFRLKGAQLANGEDIRVKLTVDVNRTVIEEKKVINIRYKGDPRVAMSVGTPMEDLPLPDRVEILCEGDPNYISFDIENWDTIKSGAAGGYKIAGAYDENKEGLYVFIPVLPDAQVTGIHYSGFEELLEKPDNPLPHIFTLDYSDNSASKRLSGFGATQELLADTGGREITDKNDIQEFISLYDNYLSNGILDTTASVYLTYFPSMSYIQFYGMEDGALPYHLLDTPLWTLENHAITKLSPGNRLRFQAKDFGLASGSLREENIPLINGGEWRPIEQDIHLWYLDILITELDVAGFSDITAAASLTVRPGMTFDRTVSSMLESVNRKSSNNDFNVKVKARERNGDIVSKWVSLRWTPINLAAGKAAYDDQVGFRADVGEYDFGSQLSGDMYSEYTFSKTATDQLPHLKVHVTQEIMSLGSNTLQDFTHILLEENKMVISGVSRSSSRSDNSVVRKEYDISNLQYISLARYLSDTDVGALKIEVRSGFHNLVLSGCELRDAYTLTSAEKDPAESKEWRQMFNSLPIISVNSGAELNLIMDREVIIYSGTASSPVLVDAGGSLTLSGSGSAVGLSGEISGNLKILSDTKTSISNSGTLRFLSGSHYLESNGRETIGSNGAILVENGGRLIATAGLKTACIQEGHLTVSGKDSIAYFTYQKSTNGLTESSIDGGRIIVLDSNMGAELSQQGDIQAKMDEAASQLLQKDSNSSSEEAQNMDDIEIKLYFKPNTQKDTLNQLLAENNQPIKYAPATVYDPEYFYRNIKRPVLTEYWLVINGASALPGVAEYTCPDGQIISYPTSEEILAEFVTYENVSFFDPTIDRIWASGYGTKETDLMYTGYTYDGLNNHLSYANGKVLGAEPESWNSVCYVFNSKPMVDRTGFVKTLDKPDFYIYLDEGMTSRRGWLKDNDHWYYLYTDDARHQMLLGLNKLTAEQCNGGPSLVQDGEKDALFYFRPPSNYLEIIPTNSREYKSVEHSSSEPDGAVTGWLEDMDGGIYYFDENYLNYGQARKEGIQTINRTKYYFDDYRLVEGLIRYDGELYYQEAIPGSRIYWDEQSSYGGSVKKQAWEDWSVEKIGLASGWRKINDAWYYFVPGRNFAVKDTVYATGAGYKYLFSPEGILRGEGWYDLDGRKYYVGSQDPEGRPCLVYNQWVTDKNGNTFYLGSDGAAVSGMQTINNVSYVFHTEDGHLLAEGKYNVNGKLYIVGDRDKQGRPCVLRSERLIYSGRGMNYTDDEGNQYFINEDGSLKTGEFVMASDKKTYFLDETGIRRTGWVKYHDQLYYAHEDGSPLSRLAWETIDGKDYYFGRNGYAANGLTLIDGHYYYLICGEWQGGVFNVGQAWWYFSPETGRRATGEFYVEDDYRRLIFVKDGICQTGWVDSGSEYEYFSREEKCLIVTVKK